MRHFIVGRIICAVLAFTCIGGTTVLRGDGALIGIWKLNLQKSKFLTGAPYRSSTRSYEPFDGDGIRFRVENVEADGTTRVVTWSAHFDGKDYPNTDTSNRFDAVSVKRIDAHTTENTLKRAGRVIQTTRIVISEDGRTMTVLQERDATNVLVFEKQ